MTNGRAGSFALLLVALGACSAPANTGTTSTTQVPSAAVNPTMEVHEVAGLEDRDGRLRIWKETVLDRVDPTSLPNLRAQVQSRVDLGTARDEDLKLLPPGIAIERRLELSHVLAFDKACLKLVDDKIAGRK